MARKAKCIECDNCMNFALPEQVNSNNIDYAKHCLNIAKRSVVCDVTMKTKSKDHEQYCKYFVKKKYNIDYQIELEELQKKIEEYEKKVGEQNV